MNKPKTTYKYYTVYADERTRDPFERARLAILAAKKHAPPCEDACQWSAVKDDGRTILVCQMITRWE